MSGDNFSLPVDRFDGLLLDTYVVIGSYLDSGVNHSRMYTGHNVLPEYRCDRSLPVHW